MVSMFFDLMLLYLISMIVTCHLCSYFIFASFPFLLTFCFPPPPPFGLCWCHRTNKTYAFLPRVGWAGTPRVSVRRFWGGRAPLHAAVAAGARQYRCSAAAFFYPLPVPQAWQVRLFRRTSVLFMGFLRRSCNFFSGLKWDRRQLFGLL